MSALDFTDHPELRTYNVFNPGRIAGTVSFRSYYEHRLGANREELRRNIAESLGLAGYSVVGAEQIHGGEIAVVNSGGSRSGVDGLATNERGLILTILVADCLPVYLWSSRGDCISLIHAGWRGALQDIAANGVKCLTENFDIEQGEIEALLGPCICRDCYEVGADVAERFDAACLRKAGGGRYLLDIREAVKRQLLHEGVREDAIRSDESCTRCRPDLFFSFRRDGDDTGRMVAAVTLLRD